MRILRQLSLAHVALALGVAVTLAAWCVAAYLVERRTHADFEARAEAATSAMQRRTQRYIDLLHGLEGLFGHDPSVSRAEFHRYVAALALPDRFPGVQAMEFLKRLRSGEIAIYESVVRSDRSVHPEGYPGFAVMPPGDRPEYYVIHYVEPMKGNEPAFGLDILTREGARTAAERARDSGLPASTGIYRLVQEKQGGLGLVVYLPVFESYRPQRTLEQRRQELAGFVNIVFRVDDIFSELLSPAMRESLQFAVHDVGPLEAAPEAATRANLLHASSGYVLDGPVHASRRVAMAGRQWLAVFQGRAGGGLAPFHPSALLVLAGGLVISGLLFMVLRTQARSRAAAEEMAAHATHELRDQLAFSRQLLEAIPNPVFFKDAAGRYIGCNRAFEEFTNRPRSEYLGRTVLEVTQSESAKKHHEIESQLLREGGSRVYEMSLTRSTDGRKLDAIFNKATFVDADGKVAGLVGVIIEITDRKQLERTITESNIKLSAIIEASPLAIIARGLDSRINLWNPAAEQIFGWKAEEVLGTETSIVPPRMRDEVRAMRHAVEKGLRRPLEETVRMRKDGTEIDVSLSVAALQDAQQKITGTMVLIADISRRKQAEDALRESEAQLRLAMEAAEMGSWFWNLETGQINFSAGMGPLFGLPRGSFHKSFAEFIAAVHPEDRATVEAAVKRAIKVETNFELENKLLWPDGSVHWITTRGQVTRAANGRAERIVGVAIDVTNRKLAEQRIAYLAHHDALTGLPNRLLLQDRIAQAVAHAHRNGTQVAVMFIDLDHFKTINDSLGHQQGDVLLQLVAQRIQGCLREIDTVSRLGGDEFVVVIPAMQDDPAGSDATAIAVKLLEALSSHFHVQSHDLHIGASIGISVHPQDGATAEILMRNADTAMYHAKERGRNQYQFFTREMNTAAQQRMTVQVQLRRSLQSNDFRLHYQPVFAAAGETLVGFEALLRWQQPGGLVRPGDFISVAEDSGLIIPIGEWVIREACRTAARWRAEGHDFRIALNVSAIQLRRKSFPAMVAAILAETGADPRQIEMEITESVIVGGHEEAATALRHVDALGIAIAIDDFGTGYSGLSYLKQFPIDTVKIDQSFVRDLTVDAEDEAIVRAIVAMAKSLKLSVVAEGVETEAQLARLKELGCDYVQGYFFSQPMDLAAADAYIARRAAPARRRVG